MVVLCADPTGGYLSLDRASRLVALSRLDARSSPGVLVVLGRRGVAVFLGIAGETVGLHFGGAVGPGHVDGRGMDPRLADALAPGRHDPSRDAAGAGALAAIRTHGV